jgi:hypothetical protein
LFALRDHDLSIVDPEGKRRIALGKVEVGSVEDSLQRGPV